MTSPDRSKGEIQQGSSGDIPRRSYSPTEMLFLVRITHVRKQRDQLAAAGVGPEDWRRRLADKALYSSYRDCVELGMSGEAKMILAPADKNS